MPVVTGWASSLEAHYQCKQSIDWYWVLFQKWTTFETLLLFAFVSSRHWKSTFMTFCQQQSSRFTPRFTPRFPARFTPRFTPKNVDHFCWSCSSFLVDRQKWQHNKMILINNWSQEETKKANKNVINRKNLEHNFCWLVLMGDNKGKPIDWWKGKDEY